MKVLNLLRSVIFQKVAGLCGVISPLTSLSLIALAISNSLSWFRWTDNALSDLAGNLASATSATVFNSGLILGGLLGIIFAIGLMASLHKHILGFLGTLVLAFAEISLIAIGIFPEPAGRIHFYVSVAFFTLFPISMLLVGASMVRERSEKTYGLATLMFGIFAVLSAAPMMLVQINDIGIHELLAALSGVMWSTILGIKLYRGSSF
jgi:hypothetical membrane protein